MQEVVNEPTNKYSDVFIRNLAQKHMEDKQVKKTDNCSSEKENQKWPHTLSIIGNVFITPAPTGWA
jgi:hypothetical protein